MDYMAKRRGKDAGARQDFAKTHPPRDRTGMVPLCDLGKEKYKGEEGGLYPDGRNTPPPAHLAAGMAAARSIAPLDSAGHKAEDGKIVLVSIGMSNTTMEFRAFQRLAAGDKQINPRLAIVDGAQGGQTARVTADPQARFWSVVDQRLAAAGVSGRQVQVAWIKQANAGPREPFPVEAKRLAADLVGTIHNMADRFPNLKIIYLSSRIYAGYAVTPLNPEPHAYETAWAVKWVIADQIAGKPELSYDPARGKVRAPWLAWGPYLWADGAQARSDGLTYVRDDLAGDGTHPSASGTAKVARQLMDIFKTDATARPWFVK